MKIKADFVTNSSSTAYVVFIPYDFFPSDETIQETIDNLILYDHTEIPKGIFDLTKNCIEGLKDGGVYDENEDDGSLHVYVAIDLCEKNKFIIADVETGVGGMTQIIGVTEEVLDRFLTERCLRNLKIKYENTEEENEQNTDS